MGAGGGGALGFLYGEVLVNQFQHVKGIWFKWGGGGGELGDGGSCMVRARGVANEQV